jgi:hypothetical protein
MNPINKDEMFSQLKSFLKTKGIEIQEGSYSDGIRRGCDILTDTVNLSQRALVKAKDAVDKGFDQVRQTVHEKTAPKSKPAEKASPAKNNAGKTKSSTGKASSAKAKTSTSRGKKRSK